MTTKSEIGALNFYGQNTSLAPILQTGRGRDAALRAARGDEKRLYRMFPTQEASFCFADSKPHLSLRVWAYEIDENGRRRFVVASYYSFWRWYRRCIRRGAVLHFYEIIRRASACRLYFDLEYTLAHNSNVDGNQLIVKLREVIGQMKECAGRNLECVVLDSTTERKWSKHLIFPSIVFYDNEQAGEFVEKVVQHMGDDALVNNSDGARVPFVDLAVYSKNRCFRLVASSKFGKTARLLPEGHPKEGRLSIGETLFFDSLVCNVSADSNLIGSLRPIREAPYVRRNYSTPNRRHSEDGGDHVERDSLVDKYVMSIVGPHGGGIYGVTSLRGALAYSIKGGYKYCARIQRHHKSNNVIFVADLVTREMFQKCFDPDCAQFCSDPWDIPEWVFPTDGEDKLSDAALNDMMDKLDQTILVDRQKSVKTTVEETELTDEVLNAVMDCVEAELYGMEMETGNTG